MAIPSGKTKIAIDPVTRIEGHLKADVTVENGKVVDARLTGGMYRGFESILKGRDPRDASQIVQRICGVCPTAHATASALAQEAAYGTDITTNARVTRNLMLGANYLQSHILHFYHLAGQDFIQGPDSAPFVPRYKNPDLRLDSKVNAIGVDQYIEALDVRQICHEMVAIFGGKMPHVQGLLAGGTTQIPTKETIIEYAERFARVRKFVEEQYVPVVYTIGASYKDLFEFGQGHLAAIAFGVFPLNDQNTAHALESGVYYNGKFEKVDPAHIVEYVGYSWFNDEDTERHFSQGRTRPDVHKKDAYSFSKAPRYKGIACEVGPLARMWITNPKLSPQGQKLLKEHFNLDATYFRDLGEQAAFSLMGRHIARAEESWHLLAFIEGWLQELVPGEETFSTPEIPEKGKGLGMTEAPRGSLLHYLDYQEGVISNYQMLPATLWNCSPRDDSGKRGALEEALIGVPVPDIDNPVNVARLIRAYDP